MFVPHARVRLAGGPESPRRRRYRQRRRRLHVQECLRMPCLPQTCVVCFLGSVVLLSGVAMSVVGYQPERFGPGVITTPASAAVPLNHSDPTVVNVTASFAYGAGYYAIKSLSYLGPVLMGCGLFVIIVAGVLYCEIMDKYVNVVPNKNAKRLPRKELYELIIKEFRKHYFRGIEVPLRRPGEAAGAGAGAHHPPPETIKMSLFKALSVSTPALLVTPEISRRWQDAQGARMAALTRHKHHPRLKQLVQDDVWLKTSSLPSVRPSDAGVTFEDECAPFPDTLHRSSKRMSKSCTNVLGLFKRSEEQHGQCSRSSGFDNPAYNPDEVKRKLLSLPIQRDVLGKSLDEALTSGVDPMRKGGHSVDWAPDVSSNSIPLLSPPPPQAKHGLFVKNRRAALHRSHHSVPSNNAGRPKASANRLGVKVNSRLASEAMPGGSARKASVVVQRASSASSGVHSMSMITCPAAASGGEEGLPRGSTPAGCGQSASYVQLVPIPDPFEGPGSWGQSAALPGHQHGGVGLLTPNRSFDCRLRGPSGSSFAGHQAHRRLSADAAFSSKLGRRDDQQSADFPTAEPYPRTRAYSHGRKLAPHGDVLLLKPQFYLDRELSAGNDTPPSGTGSYLVPGSPGYDALHVSRSASTIEAGRIPTLQPPLQPRPARSWTGNIRDTRSPKRGDYPFEQTSVAAASPVLVPQRRTRAATCYDNRGLDVEDPAAGSTAASLRVLHPGLDNSSSERIQTTGSLPLNYGRMEEHLLFPSDGSAPGSGGGSSRTSSRTPSPFPDLACVWESSPPPQDDPLTTHSLGGFLAPPPSSSSVHGSSEALQQRSPQHSGSHHRLGRGRSSDVAGAWVLPDSARPAPPLPQQSVIVHEAAVHRPPDSCDVSSVQSELPPLGLCPPSGGNPFVSRRRRSSVPVESRDAAWLASPPEAAERTVVRATSWDGDKEAWSFGEEKEGEFSAFDPKAESCDIASREVPPDRSSTRE